MAVGVSLPLLILLSLFLGVQCVPESKLPYQQEHNAKTVAAREVQSFAESIREVLNNDTTVEESAGRSNGPVLDGQQQQPLGPGQNQTDAIVDEGQQAEGGTNK
jgi:hypothetical protein